MLDIVDLWICTSQHVFSRYHILGFKFFFLVDLGKDKNHQEVPKHEESRFFSLFLPDDRRIQKALKHTDPADPVPDPQHRKRHFIY
jgi:hypothetical protein